MQLRDYQIDGERAISGAWTSGNKNVLYVLATGGGKTVLFTKIAADETGATCIVAHRQEIVTQISLALCGHNVTHRLIVPKNVVRFIIRQHINRFGRVFYDPGARVAVAGVDTLIRRGDELKSWLPNVTLWIQDEAHHIQRGNKWATACDMMPGARGLGVTAEPSRADGGGLGRHADGVFDVIVEGPGTRELIDRNWLSEYEIVCPGGDIDLSNVSLSPQTGDYSKPQLRAAVRKSKIVGKIVYNYLRFAAGRLGLTFTTDVETAVETAAEYTRAGVPAAAVSHRSSDAERQDAIERFRARELLQLVNCDLFGEGFDLPAVEVVTMARPTESFGLYLQQFGRGLRIMDGKQRAIIIDHAGNVERHHLPDTPRPRSLNRREGRGRVNPQTFIPLRVCTGCTRPFAAVLIICPYCQAEYVPDRRHTPELVDGDLDLLDVDALDAIRAQVAEVDKDKETYRLELAARHVPTIGQLANVKRHVRRQNAQNGLRLEIMNYCQAKANRGYSPRETQKYFYLEFGVDVLTARSLGVKESNTLTERVRDAIRTMGVSLANTARGARRVKTCHGG